MGYATVFTPERLRESVGHTSCVVLNAENGCTGECMAGISQYALPDYPEDQIHTFQEGFYVIEGSGFARIGGEEIAIAAGTSFFVPAGMTHSIRRGDGAEYVRVFWFHSA